MLVLLPYSRMVVPFPYSRTNMVVLFPYSRTTAQTALSCSDEHIDHLQSGLVNSPPLPWPTRGNRGGAAVLLNSVFIIDYYYSACRTEYK